ncbi:MAG: hypothetical protein HOP33_19140 [Verrucomicrobia bacterium]|nr:hypothetical protein [Verrucomicrobiota bacterium]
MRILRRIYTGVPLAFLLCFGLLVSMADDLTGWQWLNRFDLWLMAWAVKLQEELDRA